MVTWIKALMATQAPPDVKAAAYKKKLAEYYVHCHVTKERVALSDLKYWNVERQEPYKDAEAGLKAYTATKGSA